MNTFALQIWDNEAKRCTFYTIKNEQHQESETDKFILKFEEDKLYQKDLNELITFIIKSIGDDHGAIDELFNRYENEVVGLPSKGKISLGEFYYHFPRFPLRIYALKITEEIVILFNGNIKDGINNQNSSVNLVWREACTFANLINEAIQCGEILIDHEKRILTNSEGGDEILLYK